ncbi:MAG TPA: MerR family DNA-binding protein [Sphingomicrobium sp.]
MSGSYSIGAFARAGGVGVETVRYYERRKLLTQPVRRHGRIRKYGEADLDRLRFIKRAQSAGFSLDEVEILIGLQRSQACHDTRRVLSAKLADVEARLADLCRLRDDLKGLVARCDADGRADYCPALDDLAGKRP